MTNPTTTAAWQQLHSLRSEYLNARLSSIFQQNPKRFLQFSTQVGELFVDYSKNFIDNNVLDTLFELARELSLPAAIERLRKAQRLDSGLQTIPYTALRDRSPTPMSIAGDDISSQVRDNLFKMNRICRDIRSWNWRGFSDKPLSDVVTLGVGGAANGAEAVHRALRSFQTNSIQTHFISNTDSQNFRLLLTQLNPETTLFIISSKSFTTQETLHNANLAREWILSQTNTADAMKRHFIGITAHKEAATSFGIHEDNILPVWDWLPGRYSLWAAAGLPVAIAIGMERFEEFLAGASEMDQHFFEQDMQSNVPAILAMLSIWYTNFWQAPHHAVLPYSESLELLPNFVQHCLMEANGKSIDLAGNDVNYHTAPVIWGTAGSSSQHTYFQLLHQGTHVIPSDFIAVVSEPLAGSNKNAYLQFAAQTEALMMGDKDGKILQRDNTLNDQTLPGNKPSTSIVLKELTPFSLGQLLALYEHIAYVRSVIWNINPFSHWGTELSKRYSQDFNPANPSLHNIEHDASTEGLLRLFADWEKQHDSTQAQSNPVTGDISYPYF
jgi:glucose-6-phosphate isomerase